jgi:hypothetical protein
MLPLLLLALLRAPTLGSSSLAAFTYLLPLNADVDNQTLILTAQGLLNRNASVLWLYEPVFRTYPNATYWFTSEYLTHVKNFSFVPLTGDFCDLATGTGLLASAGGPVSGLALYDAAALDATRWLAATASALQGLLPVTRAMLPQLPCLAALPVVADFSSPIARGWATNIAAYEWARAALLPACSNTSVYSAGQSYSDATEAVYLGSDPSILIGLDGAVAKKMFVFNLSPDTQKYPLQAAEFQALVQASHAGDPSAVPSLFGWAEPEPAMTLATSKGGGAVMCDAAPNLSFWLHVASQPPALPFNSNGVAFEAERVYITWQTNEGDTPKIAAGLQAGLWLDERRGSIPMAWGMNPLLLDIAPGLLEFYAATATKNDTFFSATAGAGYAYPSRMPPANFATYVMRCAERIGRLTPGWPPFSWEIDIWDSNTPQNISSYAALAGPAVGMFSMQPESMAGTNTVLEGGLPLVITSAALWYPFSKGPCPQDEVGDMVQAIADLVRGIPTRPVFALVYGVDYDACSNRSMFEFAHAVQDRMGGGNASAGMPPLTVVGMQDMVRLARQAAAQAAGA